MRLPSCLRLRPATVILTVFAVLSLVGMGMNSLIVESVKFSPAGSGQPPQEVNPPYMRDVREAQDVTISLYYRGYGNTFLRLTPRHCFQGGYKLNGETYSFPSHRDQWCGQLAVNLREGLHTGDNTLELTALPTPMYTPNVGLALGSPLLGWHLWQSVFTLLFTLSAAALLWRFLASAGCSRGERLLFLAAAALHLEFVYFTAQFGYSLDLEKHIPYVQFMSDHFFHPYGYGGEERWHPPFYYAVAALAARAAAWGGIDAWTGIHLLSFALYMIFLWFGMRSILRVVQGRWRYLALSLLFFWPCGIVAAVWVFNDVLVYPLYAAAFYYLLVWYDDGDRWALCRAMILSGLCLAVKSTGWVPVGIVGSSVLFKLLGRQEPWRILLSRQMLLGAAGLAAGALFNAGRWIHTFLLNREPTSEYLGGAGSYEPHLRNFLPLQIPDLINHPLFVSWEDASLWNLQARTLLFTNTVWAAHPQWAAWLELLLLLMLAYIAAYALTMPRRAVGRYFPLLAGLALPEAATIGFTLLSRMGSCMDFRYIQPALVAIVTVFALAVQKAKENDWPLPYYLGGFVAAAFSLLSIAYFEVQI